MTTSPAPVPMTVLPQLMWGFSATVVLTTAIDLDIFSAVAAGNHTAESIAAHAKSNERGTRALLDAVVGFGMLRKPSPNNYQLTPESETFLVKSSPYYFGPMAAMGVEMMHGFTQLPQAIRTGKPALQIDEEKKGVEFFARLIEGLFPLNYPIGRFVADRKLVGSIKDVLDVAVGSGAWSVPLAETDPGVHVTGLDFPDVLKVTRKFFDKRGVGKQFSEMPGNLRETDFGAEKFDLVILGHILHSEGESSSRALLKKVFRALRPGGRVLVAEFIPNDDRTGPPQPLVFTLNMFLNTTEGTTFTMPELREMLTEAGFKSIRTIEAPAPSPLVLAEK